MTYWRVLAAGLLLAASACSNGSAEDTSVDVTIRFSRFNPDHFEFPAGTMVTFVVTNKDPIDHEFIIGNEHVQQVHEEGTEAHHGARPGEISIPAGGARSTTYKFAEPGTLLIGCHLPGHYDFGMRGDIEVTD
ncbi:MAG: cupredoxin domain-containing protein [Actinomycetota bacterium]